MTAPASASAQPTTALTTAPKRALSAVEQVQASLNKPESLASLKKNLPDHISPERFTRVAMMALQRNPKLVASDIERATLYTAIQACAQDGLLPDGREAALVPFGGKIQYMPMVAGLLKKVRNSGELKTIMAQTVYEKDPFSYFVDENGEHLSHKPDLMEPNRGKLKGVYALAQTKDGGIYMEVLSKAEVEKAKAVGRSGGAIWNAWESEMWEKTALRKLCKRLPMSTDILGAILREDEEEPLPAEIETAPDTKPEATPQAGSRTRAAVLDEMPKTAEEAPPAEPKQPDLASDPNNAPPL